MTGSFSKIDYRLRPAKHAERGMLCELFRRLKFCKPNDYQYIGFGSVAFVDFRMVHRALGLKRMFSIEDARTLKIKERFKQNKPFRCIKMVFGNSAKALPQIDFKRRSLVWLDYDDQFCGDMVSDLRTVASDLASGSFIGLTFSNQLPFEEPEVSEKIQQLKDQFPDYVEEDAKIADFSGRKIAEFARTVITEKLLDVLGKADASKAAPERRTLKQVCYIRYRDNASMTTLGWMVVAEKELALFDECDFESLEFTSESEVPFTIKVPKITPHEVRALEKFIPNKPAANHLKWIPTREKDAFFEAHRYLPNFGVIEPT
ncbi:MAG: O-methyltransferase [Erythrobacter sp.]